MLSVPRLLQIPLLTLLILALILGAGALYTYIGARAVERAHPPAGRLVMINGVRLHVLDEGTAKPGEPALVLIHGASDNLEDWRVALGDRLRDRRVIMIDRPGLGWSDGPAVDDGKRLARQVTLIHDALTRLNAGRVVMVAHSLGGALALNYALTYRDGLAGLVLLSPVTHPWIGGIALYYNIVAMPVVGPLFAYTLAYPLAQLFIGPGIAAAFTPQPVPAGYRDRAAIDLGLRPQVFLDNARDVAALQAFVTAQQPRYGEIAVPTAILAGDSDVVVSTNIHARALTAQLPEATLTVFEKVGHMPQHVWPDRVVAAIAAVSAARKPPAADPDKLLAPPQVTPQVTPQATPAPVTGQ